MTKDLNIIIGAGFSYYAGLPLGVNVQNKFDRSLIDKIMRASSSEWFWTEGKDSIMVHNCRLNTDGLEYGFIMEEVINSYKATRGKFEDYEDFYQYIKDNTYSEGWYEGILTCAKKRFYLETMCKEDSKTSGFAFRSPERSRPQEIINYLIADLLNIDKTDDELKVSYEAFIKYIQNYESVYIFSLNHDRLFERLFKIFGINYCDGFSVNGTEIYYDKKALPSFKCDFSSASVKLIKLHGSIDMYLFGHGTQEGSTLTRNDEHTYFKPGGYHEKHHPVRVNPSTLEPVQTMNFDIVPKFITGKNKKAFIEQDYMYSNMYKLYKERIGSGDDLLVIGYSYRDEHINEELKKFTGTNAPNLINLNYGDIYPYNATNVKEIKFFEELN